MILMSAAVFADTNSVPTNDTALGGIVLRQVLSRGLLAHATDGNGKPLTTADRTRALTMIEAILQASPHDEIQRLECDAVLGEKYQCDFFLYHSIGPSETEATVHFAAYVGFDGRLKSIGSVQVAD
jgi:hypothetical protein